MDNAACTANSLNRTGTAECAHELSPPNAKSHGASAKQGCLIEQLYHAFAGAVINYFRFGKVRRVRSHRNWLIIALRFPSLVNPENFMEFEDARQERKTCDRAPYFAPRGSSAQRIRVAAGIFAAVGAAQGWISHRPYRPTCRRRQATDRGRGLFFLKSAAARSPVARSN